MSQTSPVNITVVYHSGYGHTAKVAEAVLKGLQSVEGVSAQLIKAEEAANDFDLLNRSDAIVFGCPTYMGSLSAPLKAFMEASSKLWMKQAWKNKIAAGFTNSGGLSGDKLNTLIQMAVFAAQQGMIWVGQDLIATTVPSETVPGETLNRISSHLGLMTQANNNEGPDTAPPLHDLETAEHFGRRIATVTQQWVRGRVAEPALATR
jgi:multimeric flavodoxin WrbA